MSGIVYANNAFVVINADEQLSRSTDGSVWTAAIKPFPSPFFPSCLAYGSNTFVAAGFNGDIAQSSDGVKWTLALTDGFKFHSLAYGGNAFIIGGWGGKMGRAVQR
jgi:hypothetical protein